MKQDETTASPGVATKTETLRVQRKCSPGFSGRSLEEAAGSKGSSVGGQRLWVHVIPSAHTVSVEVNDENLRAGVSALPAAKQEGQRPPCRVAVKTQGDGLDTAAARSPVRVCGRGACGGLVGPCRGLARAWWGPCRGLAGAWPGSSQGVAGALPGPCRGRAGAFPGPSWVLAGALPGPCRGHAGAYPGPSRGLVGTVPGPCRGLREPSCQLPPALRLQPTRPAPNPTVCRAFLTQCRSHTSSPGPNVSSAASAQTRFLLQTCVPRQGDFIQPQRLESWGPPRSSSLFSPHPKHQVGAMA